MNQRKEHILKDLEIQWQDHFHMRDQTWKTLNYSIVIFLGVVGLDFSGKVGLYVIVISYMAVSAISLLGFLTAKHHRTRQKQKFQIIKKYEEELGLFDLKKDFVTVKKKKFLFTAAFIEGTHMVMIFLQLIIVLFKFLGN